jgi:hypothetical protein
MVPKLVIWLDLKVASVCTFQVDFFWFQSVLHVLRNPYTTNLQLLDLQNKSYELNGVYKSFLPFQIHFKTLYSIHVIFLHKCILHSTVSKEPRDIKFAKFGQVDYFLCNLQDQDQICDLNLNLKTKIDSVDWGANWAATWHDAISRYRFGN